jgi:hypothetical protein
VIADQHRDVDELVGRSVALIEQWATGTTEAQAQCDDTSERLVYA